MSQNLFAEIQAPYWNFLFEWFGNMADECEKNHISAGRLAQDFLRDQNRRSSVLETMEEFDQFIIKFWQSRLSKTEHAISLLPGVKAKFGGDIGPSNQNKVIQNAGIYFDTIIVSDPLLRIASMYAPLDNREYYYLKYGIEQVLQSEFYRSDAFPPIAVLTADRNLLTGQPDFETLAQIGEVDVIQFVREQYDSSIETTAEVKKLFSKFSTSEEAIRESATPRIFFFAEDRPNNIEEQIDAFIEDSEIIFDDRSGQLNPRDASSIPFFLSGRMMQATDILHQSRTMGAHPLIAADVSFHWFATKLRLNQRFVGDAIGQKFDLELAKTNALLRSGLNWMGDMKLEDLVEIRKQNGIREIRDVISSDITHLVSAGLEDLNAIVSQIDFNISTAFTQHESELKNVREKYGSTMLIDGATFIGAIAAACAPSFLSLLPELRKSPVLFVRQRNILGPKTRFQIRPLEFFGK